MQKAPARPASKKPHITVAEAIDELRLAVIKSRGSASVAGEAAKAVQQLNEMYARDKEAFTAEDIRFANVLRGYLGERLAAHQPKARHTKLAKRKGDKLEHCWRCQTAVDERFTVNAPSAARKSTSGVSVCNAAAVSGPVRC